MGVQNGDLASAEGDDASDGVVRGDSNGDSIAWHHLDSKAAHTAAQLSKYLVALVTLHAIEPAAMNRHDRALHVNQIILAQLLSFQSKIVPYSSGISKLSH
jgi:hypothetical protein